MSTRILVGDCRDVLKMLPDKSVQMVCTSPPYFGLRNYNVAGQMGLEPTLAEYLAGLVAVFREVRRVLRDDGTCWVNMGDSYANDTKWGGSSGGKHVTALHGQTSIGRGKVDTGLKGKDLMMVPARLAIALVDDGWYLRSAITWCKGSPMPESVRDRPSSATEMIYLLTKKPTYFYDIEAGRVLANGLNRGYGTETPSTGRNVWNWWVINTQAFSGAHFATFPPKIVETCVRLGTSEKGACPACGSPWRRTTERQTTKSWHDHTDDRGIGQRQADNEFKGANYYANYKPAITTGWAPTCACIDAGDPVPCVVLDPFAGAGTTGLVAEQLGRDSILIELSPTYAAMSEERIRGDCPMFTTVGVA